MEERGVDGWRVGKGRKAKVTRETQEKNEREAEMFIPVEPYMDKRSAC